MVNETDISVENLRRLLQTVMDPEVPVLSIIDLGIVRDIAVNDEHIEIIITPTYSGCPAMNRIEWDIKGALLSNGYADVQIRTVLSPAWTTDWMTEKGKQELKAYGIAPPNPVQSVCSSELFAAEENIQCPRCNSFHTHRISEFGSTACKSLYKCDECLEPFDYFKCH